MVAHPSYPARKRSMTGLTPGAGSFSMTRLLSVATTTTRPLGAISKKPPLLPILRWAIGSMKLGAFRSITPANAPMTAPCGLRIGTAIPTTGAPNRLPMTGSPTDDFPSWMARAR